MSSKTALRFWIIIAFDCHESCHESWYLLSSSFKHTWKAFVSWHNFRWGVFFSTKMYWYCSYLSMKTCCRYSLEVPRGDIEMRTHNICFRTETILRSNKKYTVLLFYYWFVCTFLRLSIFMATFVSRLALQSNTAYSFTIINYGVMGPVFQVTTRFV